MTKSLRYHVLATCQTLLQGKSGYGKVHNFQHFPVVKILIQPYNYQICAGLHVFKFAVFSNFIEIPSSDHAAVLKTMLKTELQTMLHTMLHTMVHTFDYALYKNKYAL